MPGFGAGDDKVMRTRNDAVDYGKDTLRSGICSRRVDNNNGLTVHILEAGFESPTGHARCSRAGGNTGANRGGCIEMVEGQADIVTSRMVFCSPSVQKRQRPRLDENVVTFCLKAKLLSLC